MKDKLQLLGAGILFSCMIIYIILRGGNSKIDPRKLEKIRKDINNKPIGDVIHSVNEWLS